MVPVHPQDHYLLGMQWEGQVYVDAALPDGLEWIAKQHGVGHFMVQQGQKNVNSTCSYS